MLTPWELAERQLQAYNAHDLERFVANFSDSFRGYRMPATSAAIQGRAELSHFYATERFNRPELRAELISRTVLGSKVVDCERIWGLGETAIEMIVVFEVRDGLIDAAWFFAAA